MPTPGSGRESRRSSKTGPSDNEPQRAGERREKSKSSQVYDERRRGSLKPESRRGSLKPDDGGFQTVQQRPRGKSRTHSAPVVEVKVGPGVLSLDGMEDRERTSTIAGSAIIEDGQDEDEAAGVVGAVRRFQHFQNPQLLEPFPEINIAVIGAEGVGKSTFVQNALGLAYPPLSQAAERKIPIDGNIYLVRLLELPLDDVDIDDEDNTVSWPETIENKVMPHVDGALTLYDVKDKGSLEDIHQVLTAIDKAALPSVLISCKCDTPHDEREVDPLVVEQTARRTLNIVNAIQTSEGFPETHQRGISTLLRAIISVGRGDDTRSSSATRRRTQSHAVRPVSPLRGQGHARASSEYTGTRNKDPRHSRHDSSIAGYGSADRLNVPRAKSEEDIQGSFLFEESTSDASVESMQSSSSERKFHAVAGAMPASALSEQGFTFEELVDRLLSQPTSKADQKFAAIFLALYRKFAAPGRLLEAIVERFEGLDQNGGAQLIKTVSQLRYLTIVQQWASTYPGDFAHSKTKRRMRTFVAKLSQNRVFAVAAKEMSSDLDTAYEDDDTNWGYTDNDRENNMDHLRESVSSAATTLIDDPSFMFEDLTLSAPSANFDIGAAQSLSASLSSSQLAANTDASRIQAQLLQPVPRQILTKVQWRLLMEFPDDAVARELTRIDWTMFSSIRPRDLVRQVSLNSSQKAQCKNLAHVNRMIEHFNQLAFWVANYILLRDKPKHRALMLEKFMRIARKLRELNNYNALGAIIAGVKSTAIHRLGATRELIPPPVGKDWLKLEILMAPSRSHFAYRLAWENSPAERIPYLPLHRRDLVSAEEGNKTFIGDEADGKINWKKFEVMGDVIVGMQKAQGTPYKGLGGPKGNEQIKELVLDVKLVKDEDDLFERSKQVEPTGGTGGTSAKFKDFFKR